MRVENGGIGFGFHIVVFSMQRLKLEVEGGIVTALTTKGISNPIFMHFFAALRYIGTADLDSIAYCS